MNASGIARSSIVLILMTTAPLAMAQDLGELARAERAKRSQEVKKPAKVYTNDDLAARDAGSREAPQPAHPAQPTVSTTGPQLAVPVIAAETSDGGGVELKPDSRTDLIFMATWCSHSEALKKIISDPRARAYWANKKLVFLFPKNERSMEESDLKEPKRQAGSPNVTNPDFLNGLPGEYYFCDPPAGVNGYPTALSVLGYTTGLNWLARDLKMPIPLARQLYDEYDGRAQNAAER